MTRVKIRFYRLEARRVRDHPWPEEIFPVNELRDAITERVTSGDIYFDLNGQRYTALTGNHQTEGSSSFSFYRVRHDNLPDEETHGRIAPLNLPDDSNIAEGTHIVVFTRNVVGVYMRKGAGPSRLDSAKCVEKLLEASNRSVLFTPILRPDVMQLLDDVELTSATVRVQAGNTDALSGLGSGIADAGRQLASRSSSRHIELTLAAGRGAQERRAFTSRVMGMLRDLKQETTSLEQLRVSYISEDAGRQIIDLLGDDITVDQDVTAIAGRRHLPANIAHDAVIDGYNEVIEQLNIALALD